MLETFETAVGLIQSGKTAELSDLLKQHPELSTARDESNATLLIRLIDWPGVWLHSAESARVLIAAGAEIDARRDEKNGTALAGALCTMNVEVVKVLIDAGADVNLPLGWMPGTNLDLADRICQNLGQQRDSKILMLRELFTKASGEAIPRRAPMGGTLPIVYLSDVTAGLKFFTEVLGFHIDWTHETPDCEPYFGISRGGAELHLSACHCSDQRHVGNLWVRIECDQIDELFDELQENDKQFGSKQGTDPQIKFLTEPTDQPWGFREMEIEDPDGNRITFYGPTTTESPSS